MIISSDYIRNFGNTYLSPWMNGEQITRTAAILHDAFTKFEIASSAITQDADGNVVNVTWDEPSVYTPSRSVNTTVFQNRNGSNSIVINDDNSTGTILITHNSGSVVQIDSAGTILIKSFGDTYNHTQGTYFQHSAGDSNLNIGQNYNIMIEGGSNKIYVAGDMEIECENYLVTARGKMQFNAAEGVEVKGAKISMEAHSGNIDIASFSQLRIGAGAAMSLHSVGNLNLQADAAMNLKSGLKLVANGSEVHLKGSTVYIDDVVRMAEGGAQDAAEATNPTVPEMSEVPAPVMTTGSDMPNSNPIRPMPRAIGGSEPDDLPE